MLVELSRIESDGEHRDGEHVARDRARGRSIRTRNASPVSDTDQRPGVARQREHQPGLRDRAFREREQAEHGMGRKGRREQCERQHQRVLPARGDEPEHRGPQHGDAEEDGDRPLGERRQRRQGQRQAGRHAAPRPKSSASRSRRGSLRPPDRARTARACRAAASRAGTARCRMTSGALLPARSKRKSGE